jgi:hypothetical protein
MVVFGFLFERFQVCERQPGYLALAQVLLFNRRAFSGEKKGADSESIRAKEYPTLV